METGTDCYIYPSSSLDHNSTSFASWLGLLNRGLLRAAKPSVCKLVLTLASSRRLPDGTLSIFFLDVHLLPLFFGLFTQVHLLIDGSFEGQYKTQLYPLPSPHILLKRKTQKIVSVLKKFVKMK